MTWAGCGVVLEVPGDSISMSGGSDVGSRVTDVGKLAGRVTARGDIPADDLLLGMDENGRVVVRIKQLVKCARKVGESAASKAMKEQGAAAELAHLLQHGGSLNTASWGHHKHPVCDVQHVSKVLGWAADRSNDIVVLSLQQRQELVQDVQKASCNLAATKLTLSRDAMADSIGVDIAGVDADLRRLRTDLESAKARAQEATMQLQQAHAELSSIREEASRGSTALAAARIQLAKEARWRTQLQQDLADLKAELQGAQQELAHMHALGPLLLVEEDASMNETRDQVI